MSYAVAYRHEAVIWGDVGYTLQQETIGKISVANAAKDVTKILFLCTGNSCRSQMAEGWARHLGRGLVLPESAGIEAHGKNPRAIRVMAEAGVDIAGQESTRVTEEMIGRADIVVTVCGHADEHCPVLPHGITKIHWPLEDPAKATGTEDEIMAKFRATREAIRARVEDLLHVVRARQSRATPVR